MRASISRAAAVALAATASASSVAELQKPQAPGSSRRTAAGYALAGSAVHSSPDSAACSESLSVSDASCPECIQAAVVASVHGISAAIAAATSAPPMSTSSANSCCWSCVRWRAGRVLMTVSGMRGAARRRAR